MNAPLAGKLTTIRAAMRDGRPAAPPAAVDRARHLNVCFGAAATIRERLCWVRSGRPTAVRVRKFMEIAVWDRPRKEPTYARGADKMDVYSVLSAGPNACWRRAHAHLAGAKERGSTSCLHETLRRQSLRIRDRSGRSDVLRTLKVRARAVRVC
jgi:hypothetical protein